MRSSRLVYLVYYSLDYCFHVSTDVLYYSPAQSIDYCLSFVTARVLASAWSIEVGSISAGLGVAGTRSLFRQHRSFRPSDQLLVKTFCNPS